MRKLSVFLQFFRKLPHNISELAIYFIRLLCVLIQLLLADPAAVEQALNGLLWVAAECFLEVGQPF